MAIVFVGLAFLTIFLFAWLWQDKFDPILAFATTLIASITGYYFGGQSSATSKEESQPASTGSSLPGSDQPQNNLPPANNPELLPADAAAGTPTSLPAKAPVLPSA